VIVNRSEGVLLSPGAQAPDFQSDFVVDNARQEEVQCHDSVVHLLSWYV